MDLRVIKTKRSIRTALLRLLEEKPIDTITIKELCATAEVSKPAFYYHYKNTYEVIAEIEDDVIKDITGKIGSTDISDFGTTSFVTSFGRSVFNSPLRVVLAEEPLCQDFRSRLLSSLTEEFNLRWNSGKTGKKALAITFAFNGLLGSMELLDETHYMQAAPALAEIMNKTLAALE